MQPARMKRSGKRPRRRDAAQSTAVRGDILRVDLAEAKAFADEIAFGRPAMGRNLPRCALGASRHASAAHGHHPPVPSSEGIMGGKGLEPLTLSV